MFKLKWPKNLKYIVSESLNKKKSTITLWAMCLCAGSQTTIWAHFYFQEKVLEREALELNNGFANGFASYFHYISLSFLKPVLLVACVSSLLSISVILYLIALNNQMQNLNLEELQRLMYFLKKCVNWEIWREPHKLLSPLRIIR